MKKAEILRGEPCFELTLLRGERIEGKLLRCYFLFLDKAGAPLRVGFAVSSRVFNAVQRNRIKRLLREAVTTEKEVVEDVLRTTNRHAWVVFFFKGRKSPALVARMKVRTLQPDVATLFRALVSKLEPDHA